MKKIILSLFVASAMIACKVDSKNKVETTGEEKVETKVTADASYNVLTDKSTLAWKGFKPTGTHDGTVGISKGTMSLAGNDLVGGKFMIDLNDMVCLDIPADKKGNADLVGHLKSEDFFDVAKFPNATFEITDVAKADGKVNVSGNLTIKGITKNITIPATFASANGFVTFKSDKFKFDRTEFGIKYKSTKLVDVIKEKSIDDLVEMSFDIMAQKN